jgi:hypothetical protein
MYFVTYRFFSPSYCNYLTNIISSVIAFLTHTHLLTILVSLFPLRLDKSGSRSHSFYLILFCFEEPHLHYTAVV